MGALDNVLDRMRRSQADLYPDRGRQRRLRRFLRKVSTPPEEICQVHELYLERGRRILPFSHLIVLVEQFGEPVLETLLSD